jgi:hypothetical protein
MARFRSHVTYANVIATLALFLALGGGAYAAIRLPKNSVTAKQIKNNAISSPKVKDRSLLAKDFKPGQLPAGAAGPQGPQGPHGDVGQTGPSNAYSTALGSTSSLGSGKTVGTLAVPAGAYVISAVVNTAALSSGDYTYSVQCTLTAGGSSDSSRVVHSALGGNDGKDAVPVTLVQTLAAPGSIVVSCGNNGFTGPVVEVHGGRITAIRVGALG